MTPLPHDKLNMRICACQVLEVIVNVSAEVSRGCPVVTVFEDKFPDLRDEGTMSVCRNRLLLCTKEGPDHGSKFGGHGGGFELCLYSGQHCCRGRPVSEAPLKRPKGCVFGVKTVLDCSYRSPKQ